jgi:hypothetical protein
MLLASIEIIINYIFVVAEYSRAYI